jgi:hypothetical protein
VIICSQACCCFFSSFFAAFAMELTSEQAEILKNFKTDAGADKRFF